VRLCLVQIRPPDRPTVPSNGPSVHPTLLSSQLLFSNSSDVTRKGTVDSSDGIKFTPVVAQCTKALTLCTDGTVGSSDGVNFLPFLPRF
jgi:hypothetical protein